MIYFDEPTKARLQSRLADRLDVGGMSSTSAIPNGWSAMSPDGSSASAAPPI